MDNIESEIQKDVVNDIAPAVVSTLEDVAAALKSAVGDITSDITGIVIPLAEDEYNGVVTALKTLNTIVSSLEAGVGNVVKNIPAG